MGGTNAFRRAGIEGEAATRSGGGITKNDTCAAYNVV